MKLSNNIKAGLVAVLAIAGFILLFQFMKGKNLFSHDNTYYIKYNNVQGLEPSNKVSINGLKVGQVDKIMPLTDKNGHICFVVRILVNHNFRFSKNSTVEIFEPGLMGDKEARINMVYDNNTANSGDTLRGDFKDSAINSLSSQVGPVKDQLTSVLAKLDSTLAGTQKIVDEQNRAEIKMLLASLTQTVASFKQTSQSANSLLANNDTKISSTLKSADNALSAAKTTLDDYGKLANSIDVQKFNNIIEKLDATANDLNSLIAGIKNGNGSIGKLATDDQLYDNLNKTSQSLDLLIKDMKENPKRYINISIFGGKNK